MTKETTDTARASADDRQTQVADDAEPSKPSTKPRTFNDHRSRSPDIDRPRDEDYTKNRRSRSPSQGRNQLRARSATPQDPSNRRRGSADDPKDPATTSLSYDDEDAPPLPNEAPPLPNEAPPNDDGWQPLWDENVGTYYFYNRFTQATQWENPRVPKASATAAGMSATVESSSTGAPGTSSTVAGAPGTGSSSPPKRVHGGYNPAIHGNYDPNADYALEAQREEEEAAEAAAGHVQDPSGQYAASAAFNRFTGRFQTAAINPENYNDENKSRRQMSAFFDVDAAANSHDGRSLKAERQEKKLSKQELKAFKEKRKAKKEEKRRAWLRD